MTSLLITYKREDRQNDDTVVSGISDIARERKNGVGYVGVGYAELSDMPESDMPAMQEEKR